MSDILTPQKKVFLCMDNPADHELIARMGRALSVPERVRIMKSLLSASKSIAAISEELDIPASSVSRHIDVLAEAGLVYVMYKPSPKGHVKYCSQAILELCVSLEPMSTDLKKKGYTVEMPIGMFSHCHIKAPCGMTGLEENVESFDDPNVFFSPKRVQAECIWFDQGFISYNFPTDFPRDGQYSQITFSFEVCSETMYYNNEWESDITVCVNQCEILTFTSAGDFGGRRGKYTPSYWPVTSTQFGVLKRITVDESGVWEDNVFISDKVRYGDLRIGEGSSIRLDIGVKDDAEHKGGVNLFGRNFGDYPQAILMTLE
ncbi:hypothetical protein IMSAG185_00226 [Lachnospiraceae bacterium]|jgi:predicted transcriptional regulator|nr:ArsR family transcriptional regulator [Lachnospiraceae bacterium]MCX4307365.1 ArsR family transcriptional regulator [Acetatifactor sp.]GFI64637.1 hypothetical protein IMSAG185_00226 [Lachnospiraceae bacterium]